ncbi:MAG: adenosylcobinamide-GDP ribazoletransferase [Anaerolineae bacterium]|nr:adenosylcobinamide-GDP ribazoletransferase [Anaerolineae bacterium]
MIADFRVALAFLTVVPVGAPDSESPGRAFAYFPLVGLMIGLVLALTTALLSPVFSRELTAFCTLLIWVLLTGGLHLDGFGDACDGLLAAVEPARRLEIMKDSRAGSWAVIGLVLLLLGKWLALQAASPAALILAPVMGRWVMVIAAQGFPYVRTSGLGAYFRQGLTYRQVIAATAQIMVVTLVCAAIRDVRLALLILIPPILALILGRWAVRRLGGGLTGDVYGALCETTEWLILLAASVLR